MGQRGGYGLLKAMHTTEKRGGRKRLRMVNQGKRKEGKSTK